MKEEDLAATIDKRVKFRNILGREIQDIVDRLAKKITELDDHDLESYHLLGNPDCLYGDSPIGRAFTHQHIKNYMIKKDMDFVGYFLDGKIYIKEFVVCCQEASNWMLRFNKPAIEKKKGIDAIVAKEK